MKRPYMHNWLTCRVDQSVVLVVKSCGGRVVLRDT